MILDVRGAQRADVYSLCMARRNISLPNDLDDQARRAHLNVSALAQRAVAGELDRQRRMAQLDAWLDELDAAAGPPSTAAMAHARDWFGSAAAVHPTRALARQPNAPQAPAVRGAVG